MTELQDIVGRAFFAGFKASCEGYNGEYPFDFDESRISRELQRDFEVFKDALVNEVLADAAVAGLPELRTNHLRSLVLNASEGDCLHAANWLREQLERQESDDG